jgi:hypothetical protein
MIIKIFVLPCGSVKYVRNSSTLRRNLLPSAIQWVGFTECPYHTDYTVSHTSLGLCVCCFRICSKTCKTESWSVMSCHMCRDWESLFVAREFQSTQRLCGPPQTFWIKFGIGRRFFFSLAGIEGAACNWPHFYLLVRLRIYGGVPPYKPKHLSRSLVK